MDDIPILGREEDRQVNQFLAHYDAPAYVRRGRLVQEAFEDLLGRCRQQRHEWLATVRTRLGLLHALAGDWGNLRPCLKNDDQILTLRHLQADLAPVLHHRVEPTTSARTLRCGLRELKESLERFNRRWQGFLQAVDLTRINELREGYNRFYLLEKN